MAGLRVVPRPARAVGLHGREPEVERILRCARQRSVRCVTITGPIGIGKTRLVESVLPRVLAIRPDVRVADPSDAAALRNERGLVLVASVEALGVADEHEVSLGLLPIPGDLGATATSLKRTPSVAFLLDAARIAADEVGVRTLRHVARLAVASDGHPAALEQLAGWLRILSPQDAASALERGSLPLLGSPLEARLRRATRALPVAARRAAAAFAITSGPFDLDVARAAVSPRSLTALPSAVAALVSAGILVRRNEGTDIRWHVPLPFRSVLATTESSRARAALTSHFAQLAKPLLPSPLVEAGSPLLTGRAEVVAAWEDAHARKLTSELPLAVALSTLAWNGDPSTARHAKRIEATVRTHARSPHRPRLELALGEVLMLSGDAGRADAAFARSAEGARAAGNLAVEGLARVRRVMLGPELGRLGTAQAELERAAAVARASSAPLLTELVLNARGVLLRAAGDVQGALIAFGEEAELAGVMANPVAVARSEAGAADCHMLLGETSLARLRYGRALRAVRRLYPGWARTFEGYIGLAAWEAGAFIEAIAYLQRALRGELAARFKVVFTAARAGALAELGDTVRAAKTLGRAESLLPEGDSTASRQAVHAAALLVTLASAKDQTSRGTLRARMQAHLASRSDVHGDDQRAFIRAMTRAVHDGGAVAAAARLQAGPLRGRPLLERVLAVLREAEGKPVRPAALFKAVWPLDRGVAPKKAEARVRKAISLLRDLGLHGAIVTSERGYALAE